MTFILRPYQPEQDSQAVFELYQSTIGQNWPLRFDLFQKVTSEHAFYRPGDHFIAGSEGRIVGFAATQVLRPEPLPAAVGGLQALFIAPDFRRQGVGRALHNIALDHLRAMGMRVVQLGGAGMLRLWPGIPDDQAASRGFFEKLGWEKFNKVCDLTCSVRSYEIPAGLKRRMQESGVDLHPARPDEIPSVLEFEQRNFPGAWYREFAYKTALGEYEDILVAWDRARGVVGASMMFTPGSKLMSVNLLWKELLGEDVGGMGAVGVAESERGRGIGLALVAWGSEILKQRGVGVSLIDWTGLVAFYGKAGYKPWRWYQCPQPRKL
jgi:GNAT superfamily N-acetyltransferase